MTGFIPAFPPTLALVHRQADASRYGTLRIEELAEFDILLVFDLDFSQPSSSHTESAPRAM